MTASELFQAGQLRAAIDAQIQKVKGSPSDKPARFFLFELFLFSGELDRARKQLDVLNYDDPKHSAAVEQFRGALDAESQRRSVFAGAAQPKWLTAVPDHVRLRLEVLPYLARGEAAEARRRLDEANAGVPSLTGSINGQPFDSLYDADERFGTVLEVFGAGGVYSWVPLESVESLTMNPPEAPRDILWRPAHISLVGGVEGDVLLPGLYPASSEHPDEAVKLGRATEWVEPTAGVTCGVGGRLFLTGTSSVGISNLQQIQITHPDA